MLRPPWNINTSSVGNKFCKQTPDIDPYTKLLVTAGCEYETSIGVEANSSKFCPAYSDARKTPLLGEKRAKLEAMSAVFCSSCLYGDHTCDSLFCEPSMLMVKIAMATLTTFCETMKATDPECYTEYCTNLQATTTAPGGVITEYVCVPASAVWNITGMDQLCQEMCNHGNADQCLGILCTCTIGSSNRLSDCREFKPTTQYNGVKGMAAWCQESCSTGHCPSSHCQCVNDDDSSTDLPTTTDLGETNTQASSSGPTETTTTKPTHTRNGHSHNNATDNDGLSVVSNIVCENAMVHQQQELVDRYCSTESHVTEEEGFGYDILGQVKEFAPQLLCALTSKSGRANTCAHMFCGYNPLATDMIRSAMCSLCQHLNDDIVEDCEIAYC